MDKNNAPLSHRIRERLREIIFEAECSAGKAFDLTLLIFIILSVLIVMLESIESISNDHHDLIIKSEWFFTIVFTIEYLLRLALVNRPLHYAKSFYGVVDLLSCLPNYLALFFPGAQSLLVIRILRLLRMFRILKMVSHIEGGDVIIRALAKSQAKIMVFFMTVLVFSVIAGTVIYLVEGHVNEGYANIPQSIYWAIVTISTVGYGDISPITPLGKVIATLTMLSTYAIIAVPTGIVTAELAKQKDNSSDACPGCGIHGHLIDANFCRKCGHPLD